MESTPVHTDDTQLAGEKPLHRCPRCDAAWLHDRVPRPWWVKTFLFFLPLKRYTCYRCKKKTYVWES